MTDYPQNSLGFQALLADFDGESLQNDNGTIFGLWPDLRLAFVNSGWMQFSTKNGGEPRITSEWKLGRCVLDAIAKPLRPFFAENYGRCLREGRPWEHVYECSSADHFRLFHMTTFPLGVAEGLLVVNSLRQEIAHSRIACPPLDKIYRNEHGILAQCSHCRRVRRIGENQVWDWVPAWVNTQPADTSHSLCEPCIGFYYSSQRTNSKDFVESFKTYS